MLLDAEGTRVAEVLLYLILDVAARRYGVYATPDRTISGQRRFVLPHSSLRWSAGKLLCSLEVVVSGSLCL